MIRVCMGKDDSDERGIAARNSGDLRERELFAGHTDKWKPDVQNWRRWSPSSISTQLPPISRAPR